MKDHRNFNNGEQNRNGTNVSLVVAFAVTAILFLILGLRFDIVYCLNDDLMIQSILSGRYSGVPSGKAVYLSEPLSALLAFLYRIVPSVPWFGLFLAGCYALCFFLVLSVSLERLAENKALAGKRRIIGMGFVCVLSISLFCGFFLSQYLMIHYTVVAAVLGGTAIYLFLMKDEDGEWRAVLRNAGLPVALLLLCYLVRTKVFFMALAFLAAAGVYRILRTRRFVRYLIPIAMLGAGILILMLIGRLGYGSGTWREYLEYNDARTKLYDYVRIWEEDEAAEFYAGQGYAPEEMAVYREYNVLLNESLTAEDYRKIAAYGELRPEGQRTWFQKFKEGFWLYRHRAFGKTEDYPYNIVALALYIMAALIVAGGKDKRCLWGIAFLGAVRSCLWIYLLAEGRYPERIIISLYLIELFVLLAMIADALRGIGQGAADEIRKKDPASLTSMNQRISGFMNRMGTVLAGVFLLVLALETAYQVLPETLEAMERQLETNREEDRLFELMKSHPENLYLLDLYGVVNRTEYAVRDYNGAYENYLLLGGWVAGSPLVTQKLSGWGYESAFDALDRGENVYLVMKEDVGMSLAELEDFYFWRTGKTAEFVQTETVGTDFVIYRKAAD